MKKILSIIITVCVLLSAMTISIYAISLSLTTTRITFAGDSVLVSDNALEEAIEITAEEAGYIAELFIADMIESGTCCWDEDTEIVDVVTLYDETGTAATAHTVELTEGYVVISAFADSESLIPEWSDTAMPIYDNLDNDENDNIIYLGSYEYYVDSSDTTVTNIEGNIIQKSNLINYIDESRDINNVPTSLIECCVVTPNDMPNIAILTGNDDNHDGYDDDGDGTIVDPYYHANTIYGGYYDSAEYCNLWMINNDMNNEYIKHYNYNDVDDLSKYPGCCVPLYITNIAIAHSEKYNISLTDYDSNINDYDDLFVHIAEYGIETGYYGPPHYGVYNDDLAPYTFRALRDLSIGISMSSQQYVASYDNIKNDLENGNLLCLRLYNHSTYGQGGHVVLAYAYTRIQSQSTGFYKTYLKVADGWNSSARYVDLASVVTYDNGTYVNNDGCFYLRVSIHN